MEHAQTLASGKQRDPLIDILKGIGIVSVVVGHSGVLFPGAEIIPATQFVYLYHLMLFFFTGGTVYSHGKYPNPYLYIGSQLKGSVPLYWIYNLAFLVLHNLFSAGGLLNIPMFSLNDHVIKIAGIVTLSHVEQLTGALWFIPVLLLGKLLFAVAFQTAEKSPCKLLVHGIFIAVFAAFGIYTNAWGMFFSYYTQTAFLGVPIIYLGYLFIRYRSHILKFLNLFTCIASAALMFLLLKLNIGYVELSINQIISPILFYPATVLGLVFAVSLANVLQRWTLTRKLFVYFGSISFHIMALHFLAFKCFDWIYGAIRGLDPAQIASFPTAFGNYGLLYSLLGVALPALAVYAVTKAVTYLRQRIRR